MCFIINKPFGSRTRSFDSTVEDPILQHCLEVEKILLISEFHKTYLNIVLPPLIDLSNRSFSKVVLSKLNTISFSFHYSYKLLIKISLLIRSAAKHDKDMWVADIKMDLETYNGVVWTGLI
jgi:hypothetical protein